MVRLDLDFSITPQNLKLDFGKTQVVKTEEVVSKDHKDLTGREEPDQHPMSAITGLDDNLTTMQESINGMKTSVEGMNTTLSEMQTSVEGMQNTVDGMQTSVEGKLEGEEITNSEISDIWDRIMSDTV